MFCGLTSRCTICIGRPRSSFLRCAYSSAAQTWLTTRRRQVERHAQALVPGAPHDRAQVAAVDVLHRDVVALLDPAEVEDLDDVRVGEAGHHLGLVHEHVQELLVLREVRQDALDRDDLLEALDAGALGLEDLGHAADRHPVDELVGAEAVVAPRRLARRSAGAGGGGGVASSRASRRWRSRPPTRGRAPARAGASGSVTMSLAPVASAAGGSRASSSSNTGPAGRNTTGFGLAAQAAEGALHVRVGAGAGGLVPWDREGRGRDGIAHLDPDRVAPRGSRRRARAGSGPSTRSPNRSSEVSKPSPSAVGPRGSRATPTCRLDQHSWLRAPGSASRTA